MTDEEFDFDRNEKGEWKWVYNSPGGGQYVGPTWHRTRKAALQAGQAWLAERLLGP